MFSFFVGHQLKMIGRLFAILLFSFAALILPFAAKASETKPISETYSASLWPMAAPPFLFTDASGQSQIKLSDFKGRWVLLNIWATWCPYCAAEMPSLDQLQEKMGDRLVVLPVSVEKNGTTAVPGFYRRHGIARLPVAVDPDGSAWRLFRVRAIPSTYLIDPDGKIRGVFYETADWSSSDSLSFIEKTVSR
jgi:thiol-disulfide isomerase/thioredoxin